MIIPSRGSIVGIEVIPGIKHVGVVVDWGVKSHGSFWIVLRHLNALNENRNLYINLSHVICFQELEMDKIDLANNGPQKPKAESTKQRPVQYKENPEKSASLDNTQFEHKVRALKLAELHKEKALLEKEEIKARLSKKELSGVKNVEYKMPSFKKRT